MDRSFTCVDKEFLLLIRGLYFGEVEMSVDVSLQCEYTARVLSRAELVGVVRPVLRRGHSLFYDSSQGLGMLDTLDRPVLWANGLFSIPCSFADEEDFLVFCEEVAVLTNLSCQPRSFQIGSGSPTYVRIFRISVR